MYLAVLLNNPLGKFCFCDMKDDFGDLPEWLLIDVDLV